jgi:hypothetical protein
MHNHGRPPLLTHPPTPHVQSNHQGIEWFPAANGSPALKDAIAYIECTVVSRMETPDHWVTYAQVRRPGACQVLPDRTGFGSTGLDWCRLGWASIDRAGLVLTGLAWIELGCGAGWGAQAQSRDQGRRLHLDTMTITRSPRPRLLLN